MSVADVQGLPRSDRVDKTAREYAPSYDDRFDEDEDDVADKKPTLPPYAYARWYQQAVDADRLVVVRFIIEMTSGDKSAAEVEDAQKDWDTRLAPILENKLKVYETMMERLMASDVQAIQAVKWVRQPLSDAPHPVDPVQAGGHAAMAQQSFRSINRLQHLPIMRAVQQLDGLSSTFGGLLVAPSPASLAANASAATSLAAVLPPARLGVAIQKDENGRPLFEPASDEGTEAEAAAYPGKGGLGLTGTSSTTGSAGGLPAPPSNNPGGPSPRKKARLDLTNGVQARGDDEWLPAPQQAGDNPPSLDVPRMHQLRSTVVHGVHGAWARGR